MGEFVVDQPRALLGSPGLPAMLSTPTAPYLPPPAAAAATGRVRQTPLRLAGQLSRLLRHVPGAKQARLLARLLSLLSSCPTLGWPTKYSVFLPFSVSAALNNAVSAVLLRANVPSHLFNYLSFIHPACLTPLQFTSSGQAGKY